MEPFLAAAAAVGVVAVGLTGGVEEELPYLEGREIVLVEGRANTLESCGSVVWYLRKWQNEFWSYTGTELLKRYVHK